MQLFKLKIGEYSKVIESPFGFHIIKLNNKRKQQLPPFEKVKDRIKAQLVQMKIQNAMIARVRAEKEKSRIINFYLNRKYSF
jgi:parvulin-like peptidyl-prolyl isomerase